MKLITRNTDYAARALCYIAEKKGITTVSELVNKLKIPRPFLRKLLQTLNKNGLLKSYRGNKGGFELAKVPEEMFLMDLIEIFQGETFSINECIFRKRICPDRNACVLKHKIDAIERRVISELKTITIASLM